MPVHDRTSSTLYRENPGIFLLVWYPIQDILIKQYSNGVGMSKVGPVMHGEELQLSKYLWNNHCSEYSLKVVLSSLRCQLSQSSAPLKTSFRHLFRNFLCCSSK